jgi:hypothetical protein
MTAGTVAMVSGSLLALVTVMVGLFGIAFNDVGSGQVNAFLLGYAGYGLLTALVLALGGVAVFNRRRIGAVGISVGALLVLPMSVWWAWFADSVGVVVTAAVIEAVPVAAAVFSWLVPPGYWRPAS